MIDKVVGQIYETDDYSVFRKLAGNRYTKGEKKIIQSISDVGYVRNPILVNEKMEIIDGQNRFEALKTLGYPIQYIMQAGIGLRECRALNIGQTNWGTWDYIESYAAQGNESYQRVKARWLQYGVFTPIFKTHCTKNKNIERRIWQFPDYMFAMRDAIRLRYTLAPYIYKAARETFDTGVSMCRPMYYYYPESNEAYDYKEQHMLGADLLVTAVATPVDAATGLAPRTMWFPQGKWYDMVTGDLIEGGAVQTRYYTLSENPYYARAGAIIPMNPSTVKNLQEVCDLTVLTFVPGADGEVTLYDDDGISKNYTEKYATTKVTKSSNGAVTTVKISPRAGSYENAPNTRRFELRFPAQMPPKSVKINGKEIAYKRYAGAGEWSYDGYTLAPIVYTESMSVSKGCVVELTFDEAMQREQPRLYGLQRIFNRCVVLTPEFKERYAESYDPYPLLPDAYMNVSQAPNFIMEYPQQIVKWLDRYEDSKRKCVKTLRDSGHVDEQFLVKLEAQFR